MRIRLAREEEVVAVLTLARKIFPESFPHLTANSSFFIAVENNRLIGFSHFSETPKHFILRGIGVIPSFRNKGIGSMILRKTIRYAHRKGKPIFLKMKPLNYPALRLYHRHGFTLKKFGRVHVLTKRQYT